jgi:hypothetical protein
MASTYSNLKIQLMATGENSGTWGNVTNDNLGVALEEAIVGSADVTFASGPVTLTLTNTNASQTARNLRLNLLGTSGGAQNLIVPAIEKVYIINNTCADAITVKNNSGTGIAVPAGKTMWVYNDGTNVLDAITHLTSLTLATALPPGSGGTGINTVGTAGNVLTSNGTGWVSQAAASTTNANAITTGILSAGVGGTGANTLTSENVIIGNGTSAVKFVAPGTTGNVLTSNGTAWLSQAAGSAGGDYVMQVYGSPATWTKPASIKAVKVTVVGGGGGGGGGGGSFRAGGGGGGGVAIEYLDAPAIPGPVTVTVGGGGPSAVAGGTSSFGPFNSATGGAAGAISPFVGAGGAGGSGSGGQINISGGSGAAGGDSSGTGGGGAAGGGDGVRGSAITQTCPVVYSISVGGGGAFGKGAIGVSPTPGPGATGNSAGGYGNGGGGAFGNTPSPAQVTSGGTGSAGIVIVEEFY